jgi:hypothetical protein
MNKPSSCLLLITCLILFACSESADIGQPLPEYPLLLTQFQEMDPRFYRFDSMILSPAQTRLYATSSTYSENDLYTFDVTDPTNLALSALYGDTLPFTLFCSLSPTIFQMSADLVYRSVWGGQDAARVS